MTGSIFASGPSPNLAEMETSPEFCNGKPLAARSRVEEGPIDVDDGRADLGKTVFAAPVSATTIKSRSTAPMEQAMPTLGVDPSTITEETERVGDVERERSY